MTSATMPSMRRWLFVIALVLFFLSGLTSLIYQVIWTRLLVFVFGATTFATSTVLAVFMGGLALGSFLAGRYADRSKNPFLLYGILEGVIGIWALAVPFLFDAAIPIYKFIWQSFHMSILPFSLLRFGVAVIILLVPTTCMGATLPLLARFVTTSLSFVGNRIGTLYSANTLGAVVGSICAGFVLLPTLGLSTTINIAAVANIFLCVTAVLVARQTVPAGEVSTQSVTEAEPQVESSDEETEADGRWVLSLVMVAFAASGAAAMVYEVAWTRTLLMVIGSTTYAFTTMLSTFLIGIALGSFVCARTVDKIKRPVSAFATIQLLLSLAGFLSIALFNYVPYWNLIINQNLGNTPQSAMAVRFMLSGLLLLPITFCLGAVFPIVVKACARKLQGVGRSIGDLYAANTLGAIVGAFLAGFAIIPILGAERTLVFASCANLLIGLLLLNGASGMRREVKYAMVAVSLLLLGLKITVPDSWDRTVLMSAQNQRRFLFTAMGPEQLKSFEDFKQFIHSNREAVFWKDGPCSTVGVLRYPGNGTKKTVHSLLTNGHIDASDNLDMTTQMRLGLFPMLAHGNATNVGVVGWGSGVTAGCAAQFPCKTITGIELEPAVLEASKFFEHVNYKVLNDPRVRFEINDGRNYLLATDETYDVIISEPSNPWQSGVCNLFTKEYFDACRNRLSKGGVFGLWLQIAEIAPENVRSILRSLQGTFKHTLVMQSENGNTVVLASESPIKIKYETVLHFFKDPKFVEMCKRAGINGPEELLSNVLMSTDEVQKFTAGDPPNLDDRNRLEFAVALTYENKLYTYNNNKLLETNTTTPAESIDWTGIDPERKANIMLAVGQACLREHRPILGETWVRKSLAERQSSQGYCVLAAAQLLLNQRDKTLESLTKAMELDPKNVVPYLLRANMLLRQEGNYELARETCKKALQIDPNYAEARIRLAESYLPTVRNILRRKPVGDPKDEPQLALECLAPIANNSEQIKAFPEILRLQGMALYKAKGDAKAAESLLKQFIARDPGNLAARHELADLAEKAGDTKQAQAIRQETAVVQKNFVNQLLRIASGAIERRNDRYAVIMLANAIKVEPSNPNAKRLLTLLAESNHDAKDVLAGKEVQQ